MIWKFSLLVIRLVRATESFGVSLISPERSLQTCLTTQNDLRNALNLWRSSQSQAEINFGPIEDWCITGLTTLRAFLGTAAGDNTFNKDISAWDTSKVSTFYESFGGQETFNVNIGSWDVSQARTLYQCFYGAWAFNSDLTEWDTSQVTDFRNLFSYARVFNGNISTWDTSKGIYFSGMFHHTQKFNSNISKWNLKSATTFSTMFVNTLVFNCDLSSWDISNLPALYYVFVSAHAFDVNLSEWDTGNAEYLNYLFHDAKKFNGSLSGWDTSKNLSLTFTFTKAILFNRDISEWDTSSVLDMHYTFQDATVFNQNLSQWDISSVVLNGMTYNRGGFDRTFSRASAFNQCLQWDLSAHKGVSTLLEGTNGAYISDNCPTTISSPTSIPTVISSSIPTTRPSSVSSSPPSTLMETLKTYTIVLQKVSFDSTLFILTTNHTTSDVIEESQVQMTLMNYGCNATYGGKGTGKSMMDELPAVTIGTTALVGNVVSTTFQVDRFALENSMLTLGINNSEKSTAGKLRFCLKAEIVIRAMSLNFRESNIELDYDLSSNSFSITENQIEKESIVTFSESATNIYSIQACRCGTNSYECLSESERRQTLNQDSFVNICVQPNSTDVQISQLSMHFLHDNLSQVKFETVTNSTGVPGQSIIRGSGIMSEPFKITSRLISGLFDNGATRFKIEGIAYLRFQSSVRNLNLRAGARILQQEEADPGNVSYQMSVDITSRDMLESEYNLDTFPAPVIIGCLVLVFSIAIIIYKKIS